MILDVAGTGPTVVLHPSLGRSGGDFDHLAAALRAGGYRTAVVYPDGVRSPLRHPGPGDLHALAAELWAAIDALDPLPTARDARTEKVLLVGHAFGNRLVRCASGDRPDAVAGVVLLACGGSVPPAADVGRRFVQCFDPRLPTDERLAAIQYCFFAEGNDASVWRDGWYPEVARAQRRALARTVHAEFHLGGTAPMLVVQGAEDRIAPPANMQTLLADRLGARGVTVEGCGHAMLPERPEAVASAVLGFLDQLKMRSNS